ERQDAMAGLFDEKLDLMVVIGGFNSSNTTHLQEMAIENGIPSYHIDGANRILSGNRIEHKPLGNEVKISAGWLPEGEVVVGVTSGASTPDKAVEDTINKILAMKLVAVN
ncbi:MAG: 4-hydroxy-3-methylbut-2-enyl diphosphate reductase, partial [Okeania sp. SIO4D6]|nr:4-hydroxy-3-methylbut-2-enyl diphosphate reductase [Okeania sp. SIO4D6]